MFGKRLLNDLRVDGVTVFKYLVVDVVDSHWVSCHPVPEIDALWTLLASNRFPFEEEWQHPCR